MHNLVGGGAGGNNAGNVTQQPFIFPRAGSSVRIGSFVREISSRCCGVGRDLVPKRTADDPVMVCLTDYSGLVNVSVHSVARVPHKSMLHAPLPSIMIHFTESSNRHSD